MNEGRRIASLIKRSPLLFFGKIVECSWFDARRLVMVIATGGAAAPITASARSSSPPQRWLRRKAAG